MESQIILPEMVGLEFEEKTHSYILNGSEIPSVTRIMEPLSNVEYGTISPTVLNAAAERGSEVHFGIENWLKFGVVTTSEENMGYVNGFMKWWNEMKPELVGSEVRFFHKIMRYAGTIDLLVVIDGELNLVDFKTTSRLIEKNCGVQLEAYAQGIGSHGIKVARKRILHLKKDGKYSDVQFAANDADRWRVFGSLKNVYDYLQS